MGLGSGVVARRRPTLPHLEMQYHGRCGVSRPSSGWDRVWQPCDDHRATRPDPLVWCVRDWLCSSESERAGTVWCCMRCLLRDVAVLLDLSSFGRLVTLGCAHCCASTCVLLTCWSGTALEGDLVWRGVSCLDAFSSYPVRTWLPSCAAGATTGAPEVRPSRSSRTRDRSSQVSCTHGR